MSLATALSIYLRSSTVIGTCLIAAHGHLERKKRAPDLAPSYKGICLIRDAMLGAMTGPFLIPYALIGKTGKCPIPPPSDSPPDITHITL